MKSPNNERDGAPTGHLLASNKVSSTGIELFSIKLLVKGIPWKFSFELLSEQ